jgi:hypothetical protein
VKAANARTTWGIASRIRLPLSRLATVMEFLGAAEILEVGYVQAQADETNNIHRQGIANKNSGRFGAVQYLKRPTSLHSSANVTECLHSYEPVMPLNPSEDARKPRVTPRSSILFHSTVAKLPVSLVLWRQGSQCNQHSTDAQG